MTTRYVGPGGNDGNNGLTWATRKLTLNGVEDTPVVAGDLVYVAPGTYRELLTVDVSGGAGNAIEYRGDYIGANTDGVGGVVRITGSDDDQTATRANCIVSTSKNYRTFTGFCLSLTTGACLSSTSGTNWIVDQCLAQAAVQDGFIFVTSALNTTIQNCAAIGCAASQTLYGGISFWAGANVDNQACTIQNCLVIGGSGVGILARRWGGLTVKNCTIIGTINGVFQSTGMNAGQFVTVNNCILYNCLTALNATNVAYLVEDYNSIFGCATARINVNVGANSLTYPPLLDTRWFCELVNAGRMLSPWDLASYSQLINVAGTSPTATDMRGTAAIGGVREWGALEYDSTLEIEAGTGGAARGIILSGLAG